MLTSVFHSGFIEKKVTLIPQHAEVDLQFGVGLIQRPEKDWQVIRSLFNKLAREIAFDRIKGSNGEIS